jgi:hypothetical protein
MEGSPHRHKRHPPEAEDRLALARPSREVRPLAETCFDRLDRWRRDGGTWDRLLSHAQTKNDALGEVQWEVQWEVSVDDTVIRAHQHAAGARSRPSAQDEKRAS